jgi:hypothetical protein
MTILTVETHTVVIHALAHVLLLGGTMIEIDMMTVIGMTIGIGMRGDAPRLERAGGMMTGEIIGEHVGCNSVSNHLCAFSY